MEWQGWYTLAVVVLVFVSLAKGLGPPDVILLGGAVLTALAGVVTPAELFAGFANEGVLTVGALFVVAAGLRETGALDVMGTRMLGSARGERGALLRMTPFVVGSSAFLNNTPVVAMLMPVVADWCRKFRVSPSRLLIPVSYLAILGGVCTLIGTSTNLVVNGLILSEWRRLDGVEAPAGLAPISLFEPAWVGVPMALVGVIYLLLVGRRLLPDRKNLLEQFGESPREYLVNMRVQPNCRLIGQTVQQAGLRHLSGLFLVEIVRDERIITPVGPDEVLQAEDELTFTGVVNTIVDLERIAGMAPADPETRDFVGSRRHDRRLTEAVISGTSPLIGKNIRDANFRAMYNAAVIAVHRGGGRLSGRIGDIVLRRGDTLLLTTGPHFEEAHRNNPDFYLVSSIQSARPVREDRMAISVGVLVLLVVLMAAGAVPIVLAAFLAAGLMVATRSISASDARHSIDWQVLLTIAAAFGLGKAIENSGLAETLAHGFFGWAGGLGPAFALAGVYLLTVVFTEMITNNAAAVLVFPFAMAVMFAASASFVTPIGYHTNMMVFGPGGYRFPDFVRVGLPLSLLLFLLASVLIPIVWPFAP